MRGKPGRGRIRRPGLGLIPAHAGKTLADVVRAIVGGAHPRACGENGGTGADLFGFAGSSPRMRGKPRLATVSAMRSGLIPAHAGKTFPALMVSFKVGAHPRACGENANRLSVNTDQSGSSPRMRGKRSLDRCLVKAERLIPAHAGKTDSLRHHSRTARAHPRACGENAFFVGMSSGVVGSSPRMRGKHMLNDDNIPTWGLIPAHAGKTTAIEFVASSVKAHPRACGENGCDL